MEFTAQVVYTLSHISNREAGRDVTECNRPRINSTVHALSEFLTFLSLCLVTHSGDAVSSWLRQLNNGSYELRYARIGGSSSDEQKAYAKLLFELAAQYSDKTTSMNEGIRSCFELMMENCRDKFTSRVRKLLAAADYAMENGTIHFGAEGAEDLLGTENLGFLAATSAEKNKVGPFLRKLLNLIRDKRELILSGYCPLGGLKSKSMLILCNMVDLVVMKPQIEALVADKMLLKRLRNISAYYRAARFVIGFARRYPTIAKQLLGQDVECKTDLLMKEVEVLVAFSSTNQEEQLAFITSHLRAHKPGSHFFKKLSTLAHNTPSSDPAHVVHRLHPEMVLLLYGLEKEPNTERNGARLYIYIGSSKLRCGWCRMVLGKYCINLDLPPSEQDCEDGTKFPDDWARPFRLGSTTQKGRVAEEDERLNESEMRGPARRLCYESSQQNKS